MTPGNENERDGEGTRSSKRSARRRTPPTSPDQTARTPPTASNVGGSAPPDLSPRRGDKRARSARDTMPPAPPQPTSAARRERRARSPSAPDHTVISSEESSAEAEETAPSGPAARRGRESRRTVHSNALGALIEASFADPNTPVHSYSELERRSHISREALSRYVTPRPDRRRSPTIETLATIAEAMHLSLEQVCRAAAASSRGATLPPSAEQRVRDEVAGPLLASLTDQQFAAVIELLRQMQFRPQPEA